MMFYIKLKLRLFSSVEVLLNGNGGVVFQVLTWAKQHEQRLETALSELLSNAALLDELLAWLQYAETTLVQRDTEPLPQDITQLKTLITEHQVGGAST